MVTTPKTTFGVQRHPQVPTTSYVYCLKNLYPLTDVNTKNFQLHTQLFNSIDKTQKQSNRGHANIFQIIQTPMFSSDMLLGLPSFSTVFAQTLMNWSPLLLPFCNTIDNHIPSVDMHLCTADGQSDYQNHICSNLSFFAKG